MTDPSNLSTVLPVNIDEEMKKSYMDYAMSVIIGRALPDIRDGLKPVHRRILYAMLREGLAPNKAHSKCAGVVGEVLKKYHPHGDMAVYDSLVRMAQPWKMRYPLIDGQGNFGSIDGDSPAAYRYTEARLAKIADEMLEDIDKDTVDFAPNFDGTTPEPLVLPAMVPNLLVNGSEGIAVGMATNIPPHNLKEVCGALIHLVDQPGATLGQLMKHIPGPDFPTGGYIHGRSGILQAFETGRGVVQMRARTAVERHPRTEREAIIVTEIPYQVNKTRLIESIAALVREKKIEGISDLRDESDREGMRIVIELKKSEPAEIVLNHLFKHTQLQSSYGIIFLAIDQGQPKVLGLKDILQNFLNFREQVVTRRTRFELGKAEARLHILEGLKIALDHLDEIIKLIRQSTNPPQAKAELMAKYKLSEIQAQAILDMRLQRLTGLERDKVFNEIKEVSATITELKAILADRGRILGIIKDELKRIRDTYGDERRTEIIDEVGEIRIEDLIAEEDMVVTITNSGYIKRNPVTLYRAQRRGGKGKVGMTTKEGDFVDTLFISSSHAFVLFFTNQGRCYWLKVYEIPQAGRSAKGKAIVNLINLGQGDGVAAQLPVREFKDGLYIVMCTRNGIVKKSALVDYSNPRSGGIIAIDVDEGDELIDARLTDGTKELLIATKDGKTIRFDETQVRPMGRSARGVKGIELAEGDAVVGMEVLNPGATVLTVCENGYGKRTDLEEYRVQKRGGQGIITIKTTDRNGRVVRIGQVVDDDEIMLTTNHGRIIRMRMSDLRVIGRNTQGVRLMEMEEGETVSGAAKLAEKTNGEDSGEEGAEADEGGE